MDFDKAFTFVFDDPDWLKKVAINALIGLIPLIGQIYLLGWGLEVARRVATRSITPLPDVDFGTYLGHGFKAFVVSLVYTVPIFVIAVPMVVVAAVAENAGVGRDVANIILLIVNLGGGLLILLYSLVMGLLLPAALTRAVVFGSIRDGLQFGQVFGLVRAAPVAYLLTLVGTLLAGMLASLVGSLACGVGIIFTLAYQQLVTGHLYGQAYLQGSASA
ncbi:MAG: DUF4013 domain-containing protein [Anaerolineae bacterium]|nr:DUF4013 domain-containing protein [Anaerolineae bacterium]